MVPSVLSFIPYIQLLQQKIKEEKGIHATLYRFILRRFERHPELLTAVVDKSRIKDYGDVLELIEDTVFPLIHENVESMFALSSPLSSEIFYCTDAFYNACFNDNNEFIPTKNIPFDYHCAFRLMQVYRAILERFYNHNAIFEPKMAHAVEDAATGLSRYLSVSMDSRFVEIKLKGKLPQLDARFLSQLTNSQTDFELLRQKLPLSLFELEGFTIVSLHDVTSTHIPELIKNAIINVALETGSKESYFTEIITAIKTLLRTNKIEAGLLPLLKVNDEFVLNETSNTSSVFIRTAMEHNCCDSSYSKLVHSFTNDPKPFFVADINSETLTKYPYLQLIKDAGIEGILIIPLSWNKKLMGILELSSITKDELYEKMIARLEPVLPLLSQLLKQRVEDFDNNIQTVIKEKFTSLQPSVEWKFNEVAWKYLAQKNKNGTDTLEPVFFKDVYPLYGTVDIRNSSSERINALQADMHHQFTFLINTLEQLKKTVRINLVDEKIFQCKKWIGKVSDQVTTDEEIKLLDFFDNDIKPFVTHFRDNFPEAKNTIDTYLKETDSVTGQFSENRRQLEDSMQLINTTVSNFLETQRDDLQKTYPNYFEKFRSDGIEYDIYIGQSITPNKPFSPLYLENLRLWQVSSMAEITRLTHNLVPQMQKPLYTTQLILVHTNTIDVSFRTDERRFDVEGAYNIRYEVIKKRIDKVHVKKTGERLTQPGKIALVYFNDKDAEEYITYINYLQNSGLLAEDIEHIELEDLQGVAGLKAIRVTVNLD